MSTSFPHASDKPLIWLVEDDASIRFVLEKTLQQANFEVRSFCDAETLLATFPTAAARLTFTDVRMPGLDGLQLTQKLRATFPQMPVVVMSALTDLTSTVAAFDVGAFDFLAKPFDLDQAIALAQRAAEISAPSGNVVDTSTMSQLLVGNTPKMQEIFRTIGKLSKGSLSVLITGETGTGKELVARALHLHSPRSNGPFIALNTAAIAPDLLESELFGHEAGAFTGATKRSAGRFEQAHGGTLFLDEIGDMPLSLQAKLLRVLAEGEFYPLGSRELKRCDVRILTATHRDLPKKVEAGEFRADLLHRLNVVQLQLPPLREREADIALLAERFLREGATDTRNGIKRLSPAARALLEHYAWPGNVRELRNICQRLAVLAPGESISEADVRELGFPALGESTAIHSEHTISWSDALRRETEARLQAAEPNLFNSLFAEFEQVVLSQALHHARGERQTAARKLGVGRNSFSRKLKLDPET